MKFPYVPAVAFASCFSSATAAAYESPSKSINVDVAIIGGGSGGIHAAVNLQDAGAKVAVIEKKSQIGGHAETYINPKTKIPANIGVVVFEDSEVVQNYFDLLGVATAKTNPITSSGESKSYDFSLGIPIPPQNKTAAAASQQAIAEAIQAYTKNVLSKYPWVDQGYPVPNPVPKELTLPFGQFAQQNGFSALLPLIAQLNWYPGNITTIPTLYGIKSFGPSLLKSVGSEFIVAKSGNTRSLYEAAAKKLGDSVYLDSTVVHVQRSNKGVSVTIKQSGKTLKIKARKLVVAIPQTINNLKPFDLCETERDIFSKFSGLGYVAGVANIPGLDVSLQNVGAFTPAHTPVIPGSNGYFSSGSPDQFLLGVAFDNTDYTIDDSKALIRKELTTLARAGALPADAAKKVTFPYISNHAPYNLRVSSKDIGNGFYKELLGLEGYRNTYWTGAVFAGHNSGLIWTWNENAVLPALKKELGL